MSASSSTRVLVWSGVLMGMMGFGGITSYAQSPQGTRARVSSAKDPSSQETSAQKRAERTFRTSFPLYDRVVLGGSTHLWAQNRTPDLFGSQLTAHWDISASLEFADEDVWWLLRHRVLDTQLHLTNARSTSGQTLQSTLLRGQYLRHDNSAFITIPTLGDLRVPADFDIAVEWEIGRLSFKERAGQWDISHANIVELDFMLDWLRDPLYRHRFAIGVHGTYDISPRTDNSWDSALSPMSQLSMLYGWDHARGLVSVFAKGHCGWRRRIQPRQTEQTWLPSCSTELRAEWTPFSISNAPLSLAMRARAHVPFHDELSPSVEATLGLRLGINLD